MIEILKLKKMDDVEEKKLYNVVSWWEKKVNKDLKKIFNWLLHFNVDPNTYFDFLPYSIDKTSIMFNKLNMFMDFYRSKIKIIKQNPRVFKKMQKMIISYVELLSISWSLSSIVEFYNTLDGNTPIIDKQETAIKIGNDIILKTWNKFEKEIRKELQNNEIADQMFIEYSVNEYKLFNPSKVVYLIVKHITGLRKLDQIDEKKYLNLFYCCLIQVTFIESFIDDYSRFVVKVI